MWFFHSILSISFRPNANFDIKCSDHLHCWYCDEHCDVCLELAGFGMLTTKDDETPRWRFCSEKCYSLLSLDNNFQVYDSHESPPHLYSHTSAVSSDHRELAYVFFQYTSSEEGYGYFDATLALGDKEQQNENGVYCVMYFRGLRQQFLCGFYLSEQLEPILEDSSLSSLFPSNALAQMSPGDVSNLVSTSLAYMQCSDLGALVNRHQKNAIP